MTYILPTKRSQNTNTNRLVIFALITILLLGAFLRFYQLGANGYGNDYYAATVKSMLTSWHNFFFVSYEPGGSVTVDKPPLGFWVEAASAYIFGVNGFALAFPNALAGVLSILLVFYLIKKPFGDIPALIAALTLACVPITIATERNNTIDGMLVFTLLLAAWAFFRAVDTGKVVYLILGAVVVGLAFNIKMLQAYMVLPALYLLYLLGARGGWWKRLLHLGLATVVLTIVSFAWVLIVDATPAAERPYIGSSTDNSEMELIIGHNGIERFTHGFAALGGNTNTGAAPGDGPAGGNPGVNGIPEGGPGGMPPASAVGNPPAMGDDRPARPEGMIGQNNLAGRPDGQMVGQSTGPMGQGGMRNETSTPGIQRLFTAPLATQASWLLPLILLGILLFIILQWRFTAMRAQWLGLIFWTTWLIPMLVYFSFTSGVWHTYYLAMLGPAIAALTGIIFWLFDQFRLNSCPWCRVSLTVLSLVTLGFEMFALSSYPGYFRMFGPLLAAVWLAATALYWIRTRTWSLVIVFLSLLIAPLVWSGLTTANRNTDTNLPRAEPAALSGSFNPLGRREATTEQKALLDYLLKNTTDGSYLLATLSSREASSFILATDRSVLTFGGFGGGDNVVDATKLADLVDTGKLRFVMEEGEMQQRKPEIYTWVKSHCSVVQDTDIQSTTGVTTGSVSGFMPQRITLYDCGAWWLL